MSVPKHADPRTCLLQSGRTVAVAESCTGGLLAKTLTDLPGSSRFFLAGIVTYSNAAKTKFLGIPCATIRRHGAVSSSVALLMAARVRTLTRADYGIGITGIAGPGGGSKSKPVGTVYIALASRCGCRAERFSFKGTRAAIRQKACRAALRLLRRECA